METEATGEEDARGNTGDATATEEEAGADDPADEEAAKAAGAGADEGPGGRTDDPGAAGAQGATPTGNPSTVDTAPGSKEPQPGTYLKAGDGIFIKLPWASSSRVPVEGETFDGEVLASAGLSLVDAPSSSSGEPEEEQLLRKLLSLYRARQAKLASREALVAKAGVDMEKRAEELRGQNQEAIRSLAQEQERVDEERTIFLL